MRTLYRCLELEHLTGSTADVYLEYIQRNLPEGVAMEVTKVRLEFLSQLQGDLYCCVDTLPPDSSCPGGGEDLEGDLSQWLGSLPALPLLRPQRAVGAAQQTAARILPEQLLMPPFLSAVVSTQVPY